MSACIKQQIFLYSPFTTRTHLVVEAAGCVEIHAGVEFACAYNAAVTSMFDKVHDLGH